MLSTQLLSCIPLLFVPVATTARQQGVFSYCDFPWFSYRAATSKSVLQSGHHCNISTLLLLIMYSCCDCFKQEPGAVIATMLLDIRKSLNVDLQKSRFLLQTSRAPELQISTKELQNIRFPLKNTSKNLDFRCRNPELQISRAQFPLQNSRPTDVRILEI